MFWLTYHTWPTPGSHPPITWIEERSYTRLLTMNAPVGSPERRYEIVLFKRVNIIKAKINGGSVICMALAGTAKTA